MHARSCTTTSTSETTTPSLLSPIKHKRKFYKLDVLDVLLPTSLTNVKESSSLLSTVELWTQTKKSRLGVNNAHSLPTHSLPTPQVPAAKLQDLPMALVRYQLSLFMRTSTSVALTQTSHSFFHVLCHNIRRDKQYVSANRFISQSRVGAKHVGVCSKVMVTKEDDLLQLLDHIEDQNVNKLCSLLSLNVNFNASSLKGTMWPKTLQTLSFGDLFNQPLTRNTLPANLHTLEFGISFNQSLAGVTLPTSLHTLVFGHSFTQSLSGITLPEDLHTLQFGAHFDVSFHGGIYPSKLHTLSFGCFFDPAAGTVPLAIHRTLTFGVHFQKSLVGLILPVHLHTLQFGDNFNQSLVGVTLPETLHTLKFGSYFNQRLDGVTLPASLHSLEFGCHFNQSLDVRTLPVNLHTLTWKCNKSLDRATLPSHLQILTLGNNFHKSLAGAELSRHTTIDTSYE